MAKLYEVNGNVSELTPANGSDFELEELRKIVGGDIEIIYLPKKYLIVNEDGRDLGLLYNCTASEKFGFELVGPVLEVRKGEVR